MDLLIASTALNEGAALLTANERHFSRVPGLSLLTYEEEAGRDDPSRY